MERSEFVYVMTIEQLAAAIDQACQMIGMTLATDAIYPDLCRHLMVLLEVQRARAGAVQEKVG